MQTRVLNWSILFVATTLLLQHPARCQPAQRFEVASIRPTQVATGAGTSVNLFEGGRIKIVNEPVKLLIRQAFKLQDAQIAGGPAWLDSDRYDIEAKTGTPGKLTPGQIGPLMQNLLAERFNLKFHRESREMRALTLVVAKNGPKLKPAAEGEETGSKTSSGPRESHLIATATSMELLAAYVGNRLNQIVVDRTGLSGNYDFALDWSPDETSDSPLPSLTTALQQQLGISVQPQKAQVAVLVIDSLARPTEN